MADRIHVGDSGTVIDKTVVDGTTPVDISTATSKNLVIVDGKGVRAVLAGQFITDGVDGKLRFVSAASTWANPGVSKEQVQLVLPSGSWSTEILRREIDPKL